MIPKIIHFCWLSENKYPRDVKKNLSIWKKQLPDYQFILWDSKKFDVNVTEWTKQAFEVKKYAFAADYIRFYAVYNYGGIYLDTDVEVLKKFDNLLHLPYFIGSQFDNLIEAAIFGAEKKSDWVLDCMKYYENRHFIKENGQMDLKILPEIMQTQIEKRRKLIFLNNSIEIKNISRFIVNSNIFYVLPFEYFSPKNHQTRKISLTSETYTIHHYNSSWLPLSSKIRLNLIRLFGVNLTEKFINLLNLRKCYSLLKRRKT
ncbi:glycosyl transferase [Tamlana fucoidanivorans]|uniref:Glycosyl transferase n=1 Tax=Allotamlana fucoidanivorans TaxID=2583814 RepID=A0A5C4SRU0_9FLAO|nr:glycosyl transferase [Tamlana fucoidanivorans]